MENSILKHIRQRVCIVDAKSAWAVENRRCHTRLRQNVWINKIVNVWNSLPSDVVETEPLNSFIGRFDRVKSHILGYMKTRFKQIVWITDVVQEFE